MVSWILDADPGGESALQNALAEMDDIDIVRVAHNKKTALEQAETTTADVLLVDVMLTGYRSMNVISHVATTRRDIRILAVAPGDPPYDRVILALQAGALGLCHQDRFRGGGTGRDQSRIQGTSLATSG